MKAPLVILIAIVVCILGFLVVYSQQHDMIAKAAPGQGAAGGYGSAFRVMHRRLRFSTGSRIRADTVQHRQQAGTGHRLPSQAGMGHRLPSQAGTGRRQQADINSARIAQHRELLS